MNPIETALTVLLYVAIFFVVLGGFIYLARLVQPKNEFPLPEPPKWETRTVKRTYKNLTEKQIDKLVKESDDEFRNADGLWKTSRVTVTTVPVKKKTSTVKPAKADSTKTTKAETTTV